MHFRADSIVRDAESIRRAAGRRRRAVERARPELRRVLRGSLPVGAYPHGLREVFITGGVPPLDGSADDYYRQTYPEVAAQDAQVLRALSGRSRPVRAHPRASASSRSRAAGRRPADGSALPAGRLHARLRRRHGDIFTTCSRARSAPVRDGDELSLPFLRALENSQSFETNPIFAVLHEMCYTQGAAVALVGGARAQRVSRHELGARPAAVVHRRNDLSVDVRRLPGPAAAARRRRAARATRNAGRRLYDPAQLARNTVPVRRGDLRRGHVRAARAFGARPPRRSPASKVWLTNEYEHNGLRSSTRGVRAPACAAARARSSRDSAVADATSRRTRRQAARLSPTSGSAGRVASACFIIASISAVSFGVEWQAAADACDACRVP